MKKVKTNNLCDRCKRETPVLHECPVCEQEYCVNCTSDSWGFSKIFPPKTCAKCSTDEEVINICKNYDILIKRAIRTRDEALKELKKNRGG